MASRGIHEFGIAFDLGYSCNLRCPYCYVFREGYPEKGSVPFENRLRALSRYLDFLTGRFDGRVTVHLKLLGGEPTLYPREIQSVLELVKSYSPKVSVVPSVYTNALLFPSDDLISQIAEMNGWFVVTPHALWTIDPSSKLVSDTWEHVMAYFSLSDELGYHLNTSVVLATDVGDPSRYGAVLERILHTRSEYWNVGDPDNYFVDVSHNHYDMRDNPLGLLPYDVEVYRVFRKYYTEIVRAEGYSPSIYAGTRFFDYVKILEGSAKPHTRCFQNMRYGLLTISAWGPVYACPHLYAFYDRKIGVGEFASAGSQFLLDLFEEGFFDDARIRSMYARAVSISESRYPNGYYHVCPFFEILRPSLQDIRRRAEYYNTEFRMFMEMDSYLRRIGSMDSR